MSSENSSMSPKELVALILAGFAVPLIALALMVKLSGSISSSQPDPADMTASAVEARVKPVGEVNAGEAVAAGAQTGKMVYESVCFSCHKAGMAGAPKLGDTAAWAPRIGQGFDVLVRHAVGGFNGMPAKGGDTTLSDMEVARAVLFMANQSGGKFNEPKVDEIASEASASETAASK